MNNQHIFDKRADNYAKARPGYAQGVIDLVCSELLHPGDQIADVGAGTGIFAKEFMERGFDVFCVEPNEEMLQQAIRLHAANPHFTAVAAPAEATTLPDHSVNLITAASAFHWFDTEKFRIECLRILKENGTLFTVINVRDYEDPLTYRQHEICEKLCPGFSSLQHGLRKSVPKFESLFGSTLQHAEFDFPLEYTKEKFIQRSLSSSYAPAPDSETYQEYIEALRTLLDELAPGTDRITVRNKSVAYWGRPL